MKGAMRMFSRFSGLVAAAALTTFGMGPGAAAPKVGPVPIQIAGESDEDRKHRRRQLKRPRSVIYTRGLVWKGVGLLSRGSRWPSASAVKMTTTVAKAKDNTVFRRFTDGSWRRDPMKYGPASRYILAGRLANRLRALHARPSDAAASRMLKRAMTNGALRKIAKRLRHSDDLEQKQFIRGVRARVAAAMRRSRPSMGGTA